MVLHVLLGASHSVDMTASLSGIAPADAHEAFLLVVADRRATTTPPLPLGGTTLTLVFEESCALRAVGTYPPDRGAIQPFGLILTFSAMSVPSVWIGVFQYQLSVCCSSSCRNCTNCTSSHRTHIPVDPLTTSTNSPSSSSCQASSRKISRGSG